ncbi:MAG: hypothetical protein HKM00_07900 [Gallionella sp.]|nr:hypothetical protein [Gallionella sp.]
MNPVNQFIEIAPDCLLKAAIVPKDKKENKSIAVIEYALLYGKPYGYSLQAEVFYPCSAQADFAGRTECLPAKTLGRAICQALCLHARISLDQKIRMGRITTRTKRLRFMQLRVMNISVLLTTSASKNILPCAANAHNHDPERSSHEQTYHQYRRC